MNNFKRVCVKAGGTGGIIQKVVKSVTLTESVTPKVPRLCSPCLFTFGRGLLLHLNISQIFYLVSMTWNSNDAKLTQIQDSKSPVHDVYKHGEQSHGTFGVTDSVKEIETFSHSESMPPWVNQRNTLPSKRNTTLGSRAPLTPIWGQRPHGGKKLLTGVVSPILSHRSGKLPLFTTFCPHVVIDPKLGSAGLMNQVLRFFWRGV